MGLEHSLRSRPYKRRYRHTVIKAVLLAFVILFTQGASACSCGFPTVEDAFKSANLVFKGKVTSIEKSNSSSFNEISFKTFNLYKGSMTTDESVFSHQSSATCGYSFILGDEYIVFSSLGEKQFKSKGLELAGKQMVSLCSLTVPVENGSTNIEKRRQEINSFIEDVEKDS